MASLAEVLRGHTPLSEDDLAWLQRLTADWQIVADLSFADLVLWLPDREDSGHWAAAQLRPTTGPTAYVDDLVGSFIPRGRRLLLDRALDEGRIVREGEPEWRIDVPVRVETIPVRRGDRTLGVVARNTNLIGVRTPSRLELAYMQTAADLARMISNGQFPYSEQWEENADAPRVGDGFIRLDHGGRVEYASPNAMSLYRRLGLATDLTGLDLAETTRKLVPAEHRIDEDRLSAVLGGRQPAFGELGNGETVVAYRSLPLRPDGATIAGVVLLRDVTDLRRRDRELITKDATIREVHHRVKNNLQTVAALLRLQARRMAEPEGRAALEEAVRRVGSIALVHETLSTAFDETVPFDEVADRLRIMVAEVSSPGAEVRTVREGSFGMLSADVATPLAMVLTEVLQNAVEHGFVHEHSGDLGQAGEVVVRAERAPGRLIVVVDDSGRGLPAGFSLDTSSSLGLSIVRTLVTSELNGELTMGARPGGGTRVSIEIPV